MKRMVLWMLLMAGFTMVFLSARKDLLSTSQEVAGYPKPLVRLPMESSNGHPWADDVQF